MSSIDIVNGDDTADSWSARIQWVVERFEDKNQRAMGKKIGKTGAAVSRWTLGISEPGGENLAAILRAYPLVNPDYLLTGTGPRERKYRPVAGPTAAQKAPDEIKEVLDRAGKPNRPASEPETDAELAAHTQKALDPPAPNTPRTSRKGKGRRRRADPRPDAGEQGKS